jgi:hypothetical protein
MVRCAYLRLALCFLTTCVVWLLLLLQTRVYLKMSVLKEILVLKTGKT